MSQDNGKSRSNAILVLGGGISGITAAVELAEMGYEVYLAEQTASLGGRVALMNKYFPKLCPPACGLEINYQRIRKAHDKIKVLTLARAVAITGRVGAFEATLEIQPRYVNQKCTACDDCTKVCPVERPSENDYGLGTTRAIYLPHAMALPMRYVIDMKTCKGKECAKCVEACQYGAIDLDMKSTRITLNVGAIVVATGWVPNDASGLANLGFGTCANVITNVMMERLAAPNGPTQGKILRPSDGKPVQTAVFVQCAGSRDENHLPYCSSVCCLASLKQAGYLREQNPESKAYVFYIDLRAGGIFEDFLTRMQNDPAIVVQKGKVAKVREDPATRDLNIEVEDILGGGKLRMRADLVVLATGMVPSVRTAPLPLQLVCDEYGFCAPDGQLPGIVPAGTAKGPTDVATAIQDATGAAIKAIQWIHSTTSTPSITA